MLSRFVGSYKSRLFSGRFCVMFRGVRYYFLGGFLVCLCAVFELLSMDACRNLWLINMLICAVLILPINEAYFCALLTFGANNNRKFWYNTSGVLLRHNVFVRLCFDIVLLTNSWTVFVIKLLSNPVVLWLLYSVYLSWASSNRIVAMFVS